MLELHYRGMRITFTNPGVIKDSEGAVHVDGHPVDESYDEVMAQLVPVANSSEWQRGFDAAAQHIGYLGLDSAKKLEGDTEWHKGFKACVKHHDTEAATVPLHDPMYLDSLTCYVEPKSYWTSRGVPIDAMLEVIPDGHGGWTPVE